MEKRISNSKAQTLINLLNAYIEGDWQDARDFINPSNYLDDCLSNISLNIINYVDGRYDDVDWTYCGGKH